MHAIASKASINIILIYIFPGDPLNQGGVGKNELVGGVQHRGPFLSPFLHIFFPQRKKRKKESRS